MTPISRRSFVKAGTLALPMYALALRTTRAADPVDQDRLPFGGLWTGLVGVSGGIPAYATQNGSTISAYSGTAGTIETALAAAAGSNQHVLLGAGTFNISTDIEIDEAGVELRGSVDANGVPTTIINFTQGSDYLIKVRGASWDLSTTSQWTRRNVSSGATRGSSSVVVASTPTGLSAGMLVFISATLGESPDSGYLYGTDPFIHIARVTNVSGTTVTFNDPINSDYLSGTIQIGYRTTAGVTIRKSGVRNISFTKTGSGSGTYFDFEGCDECWALNCYTHSVGSSEYHIRFYGCYRTEIRHCDVQHFTSVPLSNSTYCIYADKSNACLIIDNYFHDAPNIMPMHGLGGSAFCYNYINDLPYSPTGQLSQIVFMHGEHNHYNLFEGNWCATSYNDPGGSSMNTTWFRNRMPGYDATGPKTSNTICFTICAGHNNFTIAGNVLGTTGIQAGPVLNTFASSENCCQTEYIYDINTSVTGLELFANWNIVTGGIPVSEQLPGGDALVDSYLFAARPETIAHYWPLMTDTNVANKSDTTSAPDLLAAAYRSANSGAEPDWSSSGSAAVGNSYGVTARVGSIRAP